MEEHIETNPGVAYAEKLLAELGCETTGID